MTVTRPVIILGAARSGTKMLRGALASHPELSAIPFDINFIWKYGHYGLDHDELGAEHWSPRTARFIHDFFARFAGSAGQTVVEKTVSNTVRVEFVRRVFPDCRFVHLLRDGRDVAASSLRQWRAPMDTGRALQKVRYLPARAVPSYGLRYAQKYLARALSRSEQVSSWGVEIRSLPELVSRFSALEVCGMQWSRCVEQSLDALAEVDPSDQIDVRYEALVDDPKRELERIISFLDLQWDASVEAHAAREIHGGNRGKWRAELGRQDIAQLRPHIEGTLLRAGYSPFDAEDPASAPDTETGECQREGAVPDVPEGLTRERIVDRPAVHRESV